MLDKVKSPDPVPTFNTESAVRVIGPAIERVWLLVVILAPNETVPAPVCVKVPSTERNAPILSPPVSEMAIGPLRSVVTVARKEKPLPVNEMPLAALVERAPLNVVVPVPDDWTRKPALIACVDTAPADTIVNEAIGVMLPTALPRVMLPVPAVKFTANAPSTVPFKLILPAPAPVLSVIGPVSVIGLEKVIGWLFVVIDPLNRTGPVPFCR